MDTLKQTKIWKIRLTSILWFTLGVLFLISLPLVLNISVWLFPILIIISLIFACLVFIIRKLFKHEWSFATFIKSTIFFGFLLTILCAMPILYFAILTQLHPTLIPQVTLTNGKKTVIFQGMQHVGSEEFYKSVVYDLEDALSRDYVLLYEGVKPGTPESEKWFNAMFAQGKNLAEGYQLMGKTCGLKFQGSYFQLFSKDMAEQTDRFINADVSTLQIKQRYDELVNSDPSFAQAMQQRQHKKEESSENSVLNSMINGIAQGNEKQQFITGILCRGVMTMSMNQDKKDKKDEMDKLVLNYRNEALANSIMQQPNSKIFITYGNAHLPGTYQILKEKDPNWKIASVKWIRTIDTPKEYQKELDLLEE